MLPGIWLRIVWLYGIKIVTLGTSGSAMAAEGSNRILLEENAQLSNLKFEEKVKSRLTWSKQKWEDSGEEDSRLQKLCNSMVYWKKKLKPAMETNNVIVTTFNFEKDVKLKLLDLIDGIRNLKAGIKLNGFSEFRNPRYVCLYFEDEKMKEYVLQNFRKIGASYVVYLEWAQELQRKFVKVHWLPKAMDIQIIKKEIEKYFIVYEQERIILKLMVGDDLESGRVTFVAALREGVSMASIPHVCYIGQMEALITVQGRLPLCLTCEKVGHVSKECPTPFCYKCKGLREKQHVCEERKKHGKSYASIIRKDVIEEDREDWESAILVENEQGKSSCGAAADIIVNKVTEQPVEKKASSIKENSVVLPNKCDLGKTISIKEQLNGEKASKRGIFSDWATSEGIDDEHSDSISSDESENEALNNMESYLKELNNFKVEVESEGGRHLHNEHKEGQEQYVKEKEEPMQLDNPKLKRKIEEGQIFHYGRSGRGRRRGRGVNIFDNIKDGGEFVFKD